MQFHDCKYLKKARILRAYGQLQNQKSISKTRKANMYSKITGSSLRTPTSRLSTKKPLIMCREYEEMSNTIPMVGVNITPLTGFMYCSDCGSKMYVHRTSNYKNIPYYTCNAYTKVPCGILCSSAHRIKAEAVLNLIQSTLHNLS